MNALYMIVSIDWGTIRWDYAQELEVLIENLKKAVASHVLCKRLAPVPKLSKWAAVAVFYRKAWAPRLGRSRKLTTSAIHTEHLTRR
jgi:hypothetical protein